MQQYQNSAPASSSARERSIQPYQLTRHPNENEEEFQTIIREVKEPPRTLPPIKGKLPRGLPRRPPDITGTLIYVQEQAYHSAAPGMMDTFSKHFLDAIWSASREQQDREREKVITRMRIRGFDGEQWDAYLEGVLTGANIALGDEVSLWGRTRKGTLATHRAYNHTTRSIVTSSSASSHVPMLIVLLVLLGVVLLWTAWQHIALLPK